jgi:IS30 family transposase
LKHITTEQSYRIELLLQSEKTKSEIARILKKDKLTIVPEIKRNRDGLSGEYKADFAATKCGTRLRPKPKKCFAKTIRMQV